MTGLQSQNAPDIRVVTPHFIFGAVSLILVALMILLADTHLIGPYFDNKIVAITHMAVLGWGTMIVFGALYQLIPVVFETRLYSEKLALVTFWSSAASIGLLTFAFWTASYYDVLPVAASAMFLSLLMFVVNVMLSYKNSAKKNSSSRLVIASVFWLMITELVGTLIALNFRYQFFSEVHLHYLKIHATMGLLGWFLMLIIGVSSVLIPMFLIAHKLNFKKLDYAFYLINAGLLLFFINRFYIHWPVDILFWLLIVSGVGFYLSFVAEVYRKRMRRVLDIGMKHTMISLLTMIIPVLISLIVISGIQMETTLIYSVITLYGFSIIFGLITTVILGQTFKTLPFIIWLDRYKSLVGKMKTPMPRELYSEKLADVQLYVYLFFIVSMSIGLILQNEWLVRLGGLLLLVVAVMYNINVFKIILHKQIKKKEES